VKAICLACIIACCFVVGVDLMTKANPDACKSIAVIETRFTAMNPLPLASNAR
jgi:hypothetical protein